jgi:hypothetical protein
VLVIGITCTQAAKLDSTSRDASSLANSWLLQAVVIMQKSQSISHSPIHILTISLLEFIYSV